MQTINTMETGPVLEICVCGYFPADKKLQEQQTELLFDAKIKTSPRILKQMQTASASLNTGILFHSTALFPFSNTYPCH